ncbi:MAG: sugar phosphate isomerase/epimerase family protein [Gaiellaceae bacterium]
MAAQNPRVSVSQISTLHATFSDDLEAYAGAGLDGIGIWELKLGDGPDDDALAAFHASSLGAASAVPALPSILPLPLLGGADDPRERIDAILGSLHRLAPFRPAGVVCLTGSGAGRDPDAARELVADGLREIGLEAESLGLTVALEAYQRDDSDRWSIVSSIPEALELIADAGDGPALALQFDVWHLWNSETLFDDIEAHVDRFAGVHVCDRRVPTRGWADRELPGCGGADVPAVLAALAGAGWSGLYDIEVFSDDGTFGASYDDSYWRLDPATFLARARSSFDEAWNDSLTPRPSRRGGPLTKEQR